MTLLITGSSRGLGYHLCLESLRQGHSVLASYRNRPSPSLSRLAEEYPGRMELLKMDVASDREVGEAAGSVLSRYSSIDCIVNNAAIETAMQDTIETVPLQEIKSNMEVNAYGALRVIQAFLPLIRHKGGCIVNVTSDKGGIIHTQTDDYPYCLSKAVLNMISEKVRRTLQPEGVRVFAVHPGWMHTDMGGAQAPTDPGEVARRILDLAFAGADPEVAPAYIDRFGNPMPL